MCIESYFVRKLELPKTLSMKRKVKFMEIIGEKNKEILANSKA